MSATNGQRPISGCSDFARGGRVGPRRTPSLREGHLGHGPARQRPGDVKRIADRHQGKRENVIRQAEKRPAGENDVLGGRIDAGPLDALLVGEMCVVASRDRWWQRVTGWYVPLPQTRHEQDRSIAKMVPKMGSAIHQPPVLLFGQMRRTSSRGVNLGDFVGGLAIHGTELMPPGFVAHDYENPVLSIASGRSPGRRIENPGDQLCGDRVGFQAPLRASCVDRVE